MDSSIYADEIINAISRRAWTDDSQFQLVTVLETSGIADNDNQVLHQAAQILSARVARLRGRLKSHTQIKEQVLEGKVAAVITEAALDWEADLIMLGSHGDTGIRRDGIGSVAAEVVNNAPCSIEIIKLRRAIASSISPSASVLAKNK